MFHAYFGKKKTAVCCCWWSVLCVSEPFDCIVWIFYIFADFLSSSSIGFWEMGGEVCIYNCRFIFLWSVFTSCILRLCSLVCVYKFRIGRSSCWIDLFIMYVAEAKEHLFVSNNFSLKSILSHEYSHAYFSGWFFFFLMCTFLPLFTSNLPVSMN